MSPENLADWRPLLGALTAYVAIVLGLVFVRKRSEGYGPADLLRRISKALEHVTKIPGWAAAAIGTSLFGLLIAGMGFYNDVAWHVRLGRDEILFTAPHAAIVVGLYMILFAAGVGVAIATVSEVNTRLRVGALRVPWSMVPMAVLGTSALMGFPLDELWHRAYGIDVTMWSPTHLLMIVGASLSPLAAWLALAEAGVRPSDGKWARGVHVAIASCVLLGLSSVQGEFSFGVPQFQQLYHPVLIALAAGIALTATRLVLGPGWTVAIAAAAFLLGTGDRSGGGVARVSALYFVSAVAVELVALVLGTQRRLRYALAAGTAVATIGFAGEWFWNARAFQPWTSALLPDAFIVGGIVAISAAVIGASFGAAVLRQRPGMRSSVIVIAGLVLVGGLVWPFPRRAGDVSAQLFVNEVKGAGAYVAVKLEPADAADGARWFQAMSWQGGGFVASEMVERGPGSYVSERPVPVSGAWKTLIRLHRGAEMMAIPVWMPADPEIGAPEVPAASRRARFELEQKFLLREQHGGPGWFAPIVYALLLAMALAWVGSFVLAARKIATREREMASV